MDPLIAPTTDQVEAMSGVVRQYSSETVFVVILFICALMLIPVVVWWAKSCVKSANDKANAEIAASKARLDAEIEANRTKLLADLGVEKARVERDNEMTHSILESLKLLAGGQGEPGMIEKLRREMDLLRKETGQSLLTLSEEIKKIAEAMCSHIDIERPVPECRTWVQGEHCRLLATIEGLHNDHKDACRRLSAIEELIKSRPCLTGAEKCPLVVDEQE